MSRRKTSGKAAAAGDDQEDQTEGGVATEAAPKADRMAGWAYDETRTVKAADRALLRYGAVLVKNACKNAQRLNASLGIAKDETQLRLNQAETIVDLIDNADSRHDVVVPAHLLRAAQIGVSMEYSNVARGKDQQEKKLKVEDTKALDKRLLELDRLAGELGVQGSLALDEDEDDETLLEFGGEASEEE